MTVFSTRCCRRLTQLGALLSRCWLARARRHPAGSARARHRSEESFGDFRGRRVRGRRAVRHRAHATLEEVLNKGVPLYFLLEFELIRPRWYWFNEHVVSLQQQYRLSLQRADAPVSAGRRQSPPELRVARRGARGDESRAAPSGSRARDVSQRETYIGGRAHAARHVPAAEAFPVERRWGRASGTSAPTGIAGRDAVMTRAMTAAPIRAPERGCATCSC